jgi:hypothetical protein
VGQVLNNNGPAPKSHVTAYRYRFLSSGLKQLISIIPGALTDDLGRFRLSLPHGQYILGFVSEQPRTALAASETGLYSGDPLLYPGVAELSQARIIDVRGGEEIRLNNVTFGTARLGRVSVRLVNGSSEPEKEFSVRLVLGTPSVQDSGGGGSAASEPGVRIKLPSGGQTTKDYWPYKPGAYNIITEWDEGGIQTRQVTPFDFDGRDRDVEVALFRPKGELAVRAVLETSDGSRVPFEGASIGLCRAELSSCADAQSWVSDGATRTGTQVSPRLSADGTVTVAGLASGTYQIYALDVPQITYISSVRQGDRDVLHDGVVVEERGTAVMEIQLRENPAVVRGRVKGSSGEILHNALVIIVSKLTATGSEIIEL